MVQRPSDVGASHQDASFSTSPRSGVAGTEVRVRITELPPGAGVLLGFGGIGSPHEILAETVATDEGVATWTVAVPGWVEAGKSYLFYLAFGDQRPVAFSDGFLVTAPDGSVRLEGVITDEGVTCTAMRDADEQLYTLAGAPDSLSAGDTVRVEGTVAEMSMCMQGLTLDVATIDNVTR